MRVIVIDDEKAMHIVMNHLLSEISGVVVVGCYQDAEQALEHVRQEAIDLVFIDIMIGQDHGLEVARQLRSTHSEIDIVFVTSHKEFAIDSFDSYPLDYMIKPVSKSRLEQTIDRAAARIREKSMIADSPTGKLKVRAFGGFEVRSEQVGLAKWISKKSMELFAYLLMHRDRQVSKSRIIEHIYTDTPQMNAALYVNTNVYQLRKTLHALGYKNIIVHSQEQYWLLLDQIEIDFVQFEDQISQFSAIESDHIEQALACEQLYSGELFEDRSYEWSITEQVRLHNLYAHFAKQLSQLLISHRRSEQATLLIKKLLLSDEWDEDANLLLLQAYGELKDYVSFTQHYAHISNLYQQELSVPLPIEFSEMYEYFINKCNKTP
ncbi:response regulator [Paenibacillus eucommiae]|uniref:Two-component SAPR family response regulator n=1 Tax=Paenibacillus eucommiae TaxID=1355755 RepID=A0ABS4J574_9BACL|nr:response regulator [Paenibacillus eucommiae]MBP1994984.1 two-component SAPR family response regulator [Paenibacillus eucommiae]